MRRIVDAPSLRPNRHGLVEAGNTVNVGDERWEDGVTFTPLGCQAVFAHVPYCPSEDKSPDFDCPPIVDATAWLLEFGLEWSIVDLGADPKKIMTEAFDIGTSSVLERLSSLGIADVAAGTPIVLPVPAGAIGAGGVVGRVMGGAVAPPTLAAQAQNIGAFKSTAAAIGMVESKLVDATDHIGGAGTLLMSPALAATAEWALEERNGQLVTRATGSKVIVGNFTPVDVVYGVLGDVDVYLGDLIFIEVHEHQTNQWIGRAERRALAVWNSCGVVSASSPF
jgi:hypothetical protein